jgi:hypothetical protein
MGCDIHVYLEYKNSDSMSDRWCGTPRLHIPRYYGLFATMAGVRSYDAQVEIFKPKGIPKDISYETLEDFTLKIVDQECDYCEGKTTRRRAEEYIQYGEAYWNEEKHRVTHPDWHAPSWLTLDELKLAYKRFREYFVQAVIPPIMREREKYKDLSEEESKLEWIKQLEEYKDKNEPIDPIPEVEAIIAYMEVLEKYEYQTRLIFWFDN